MKTVDFFVCGIPQNFHAAELRNYFSLMVESEALEKFHFRHRPEKDTIAEQLFNSISHEERDEFLKNHKKDALCCVAQVTAVGWSYLKRMYHSKHWTDLNGKALPSFCLIYSVPELRFASVIQEMCPPAGLPNGNVGTSTRTLLNQIRLCVLPAKVVGKLGVQFPKAKGGRLYSNVPFNYNQLDMDMESDTETNEGEERSSDSKSVQLERKLRWVDMEDVRTGNGHRVLSDTDYELDEAIVGNLATSINSHSQSRRQNWHETDSGSEAAETASDASSSSSSDEEEWERHEALHDDCSMQDRRNEQLYETNLDVTWEKGGPGVVRYTDAQHWHAVDAPDPEERFADDWGIVPACSSDNLDHDQRQLLAIRASHRWSAAGIIDEALFGVKRQAAPSKPLRKRQAHTHSKSKRSILKYARNASLERIGSFERFTRGVGRRVLERFGWRDGTGVGARGNGSIEPVAIQLERDCRQRKRSIGDAFVRPGLGYQQSAYASTSSYLSNTKFVSAGGTKLVGGQTAAVSIASSQFEVDATKHRRCARAGELVRISTVYDEPDPVDGLFERTDVHNLLKRRDRLNAADVEMPIETMWSTLPNAQQT